MISTALSSQAPYLSRQFLVWSKAMHLLVFLTLCVGAGLFSVYQGTDASPDLANYHLYNAFAFLENRLFFDVAPADMQSYLNPLADLPFYWLVVWFNDSPRWIAFVQGLPAGIYAYLTLRISLLVAWLVLGQGVIPLACALLAAALGLTGAGFVPLIGTTSNDITVGALILASLLILMGSLSCPKPPLWRFAAAGLLAGGALGLKLTAIIYCVPLGLLVLAMLKLRGAIAFGFASAAAFLASWGPHAWHLWSVTGNPMFPFYNHVFQSPDWRPENTFDERFLPRDAMQTIFYPFYWTVAQSNVVTELSMRDLRLSIVFVALALWLGVALIRLFMGKQNDPDVRAPAKLAAKIDSNRVIKFILALVLISYLLWIWMFGIYRYLIVVETLSGICLVIAAAGILRRRSIPTLAVLAGAVLTANVVVERPDWGHVATGARVIDIKAAPLAVGSLVVMVDDDTNAYLLPFLARDTRAVRLRGNLVQPGQSHGLNRRIADIMRTHAGPVAVISSPGTTEEMIDKELAGYGFVARECRIIRSNLEPRGHKLCRGLRP